MLHEKQTKKFIEIKDLEVYKIARELSREAWEVYEKLDWQTKKVMGDQFIEATDSVGANIAEGYGRYHYLDKIKFYYNARGSLGEACSHWLELLWERKKIVAEKYAYIKVIHKKLSMALNNFITATYKAKENNF